MENQIERLLGLDDNEFNKNKTKDVEIKRLSKLAKKPFFVTIKSLSPERVYELQDKSYDKNGNVVMGKFYDGALIGCCEAIVAPDFNDIRLKKKLGLSDTALKKDVLMRVFKVNEINEINSEIMDISGFNKDVGEEIKN